jgi:hypothetical protein
MVRSRRSAAAAVLAITVASAFVFASAASAAPAMSRGQQFFNWSMQECLTRTTSALQAAGYSLWDTLGNGPWGSSGIHGAMVFCEPHANGGVVVDVGVASEGTSDGNVPGAERVRIQQLIDSGAGQQQSGDACPANATDLRGTGAVLQCYCGPSQTAGGSVWGTDVYTDDSYVCRAAVHAGAIGLAGGVVRIRILGGQSSYPGTSRNGVDSSGYGSWGGSYRFEQVVR